MLASLLLTLALTQPPQAVLPPDQNPLELSQEMKVFLDTRVDRALPQMERLRALVEVVFHDRQLGFTYAPVTRSAIETFTTRGGNCLSFTILFISMARYLDLGARFREVEVAPIFSKSGTFVSLSQHLNAAVIIGGQTYVIDVFPAVNRIEIGGQIVPDRRGLAHFLNNRGVDRLAKGDFEQAKVYFRKALETDPSTVCVWINLGAGSSQTGDVAEAERYYRKALELDPQNVAAMSNLTNLLERMGRAREASRLQLKVREFREKNPYHHFGLGEEAYQAGRYAEALESYKKAIRLKSTDHNFYLGAARASAQLGQNDEVVNYLRLAEKYASDAAGRLRYAQKLELLKRMSLHASADVK
jgi:tetratricopeptide (TPR) repeat protein